MHWPSCARWPAFLTANQLNLAFNPDVYSLDKIAEIRATEKLSWSQVQSVELKGQLLTMSTDERKIRARIEKKDLGAIRQLLIVKIGDKYKES
jgi:hypothetical protein